MNMPAVFHFYDLTAVGLARVAWCFIGMHWPSTNAFLEGIPWHERDADRCTTGPPLHDGTVLAAFPIRRPSRQAFKRDKLRVDPDGVTIEYAGSGSELRDVRDEERTRFQDSFKTSQSHIRSYNAWNRRVLLCLALR